MIRRLQKVHLVPEPFPLASSTLSSELSSHSNGSSSGYGSSRLSQCSSASSGLSSGYGSSRSSQWSSASSGLSSGYGRRLKELHPTTLPELSSTASSATSESTSPRKK